MGCIALLLIALSFLQARHKMFWGDEIMGSYVLRAGSWHRFLLFWRTGIDSSGLWYYALAAPWELVFGHSQGSLRMYSAVGVAAASCLLWLAARRYYPLPPTAIAIALVFFDLEVVRWQLSNARAYGLFLAAAALVLFLLVRGQDPDQEQPSVLFLCWTFFAYDLLAGSHLLGALYGATFLAVQIAVDLRNHRRRYRMYLAAAIGIALVTLLSLPNTRSTLALGRPVFWTSKPPVVSLFFWGKVTDTPVRWILLALFLVALLSLRRRPQRDLIYLLLLAFLFLHTAFVLVSRVGTSIYVDRYMLPLVFPLALLCAELLTQIGENPAVPRLTSSAVLVAVAILMIHSFIPPQGLPRPQTDYTDALLSRLPSQLPIVDTDVGTFVETEFYHHGKFDRPFLFPLDAEVTADKSNSGGVSGFHEMDNFAFVGLDAPDIQPTAAILSRYKDLLVLTSDQPTSWFSKRILSNPRYHVTDLGLFDHGITQVHIWEVRWQD